jgi:glycogen(starch) synthase
MHLAQIQSLPPALTQLIDHVPPTGTPIVVAAGRHVWEKGFDLLVSAMQKPGGPSYRCIIAGADGELTSQLAEAAGRLSSRRSLALAGVVDHCALTGLFARATTVVVPSRVEPFGLVAWEALASGARVVASRCDGLWEHLGALPVTFFEPGSDESLATALAEALSLGRLTPKERAAVSDAVTERSWPSISSTYHKILDGVAASRTRV